MTDIDQLSGPVFRPGDPGYDDECAGFQTARSHRPDVVVGATDADDVRAAVAFAARRGMGVAVKATGHGLTTATTGGVLVNTSRMDGFHVDATARTARLDAGVRWAPVIDAAAAVGLAPLSGSAPHLGAVSYTLGGGVGLLARRYGYAADHVRAVEVVTADGELHRVTAQREPELFWGLRGGSGLGVVTAVEIDLMPVPSLYGGGLYFDTAHVADVWQAFVEWTASVPEEMTSSVSAVPFPDLPGMPEPFRGRHIAHVRIAYAGDAEAGERLVAPLRAVAPTLVDTVREMSYAQSGSIHNEPPQPMPYYGSHTLLRGVDGRAVKTFLDQVGPGSPDPTIAEIRHLGGALARPPAVANAVGNRDAGYVANMVSPTPDTDAVRPLHDRVSASLHPWSTGGRLLNFLYLDNASPGNVRTAFDPGDFDRLRALKAAVDPHAVFRYGHPLTG